MTPTLKAFAMIAAVAATFASPMFVSAQPAAAPSESQFDQAQAAADRGDFSTAYRLWRPLAEQGYAPAQSSLGYMYQTGKGMAQDLPTAAKWYTKAANQGYADAQYLIGNMYMTGWGPKQNYAVAAHWFVKAAGKDQTYAAFNLGLMYENGNGVARDYAKSYKMFELASKSGDEDAAAARDRVAVKMKRQSAGRSGEDTEAGDACCALADAEAAPRN